MILYDFIKIPQLFFVPKKLQLPRQREPVSNDRKDCPCGRFTFYIFFKFAIFAISFFVPTFWKAISRSISLPIGVALDTTPSPKTRWLTVSPALKSSLTVEADLLFPAPEKPLFTVLLWLEYEPCCAERAEEVELSLAEPPEPKHENEECPKNGLSEERSSKSLGISSKNLDGLL